MPKDNGNDKDSSKEVSNKISGKYTSSGMKRQLDFSKSIETQVNKKSKTANGEPSNVINLRNRDVESIRTPFNSRKSQRKANEDDHSSSLNSHQRQRSVETCETFNERVLVTVNVPC